jgi:hypothetical protein
MREVHGQFMLAHVEVLGMHGQFRVRLRGRLVGAQIFKLYL